MSAWGSYKARKVLEAIGWKEIRCTGSHRILAREGWPNFTFSFHGGDEVGPRMMARIAKHTGLKPNDL